jgi:hypothetical protein
MTGWEPLVEGARVSPVDLEKSLLFHLQILRVEQYI